MNKKKIVIGDESLTEGRLPAFSQPLHVGKPNVTDRGKFLEHVNNVLNNQWLTNNGPLVQNLEKKIASYLGVEHCIAMCNGTIALEIAIRALGLTGEVIVPSWTFIATAHALHWQGITPVFVDIDPITHNLDPIAVRKMITPQTSGIIGVHLWGRAAPVNDLHAIADEFGLKLMFDAAHAFGSSYEGKRIGQFGSCEVFSFHATKAFNTMEGGAVTTNNAELAEALRLMRNFGFKGYDNVIYPGTNGKMIEMCAAMGLVNLENYDDITSANKKTYEVYKKELANIPGISLLRHSDSEESNYHYIVIEVENECAAQRDEIIEALHLENILARKYFWPGCHRMQPYRELFPEAELLLAQTVSVSEKVIVLPNGTLSDMDVKIIAQVIRKIIEDKGCLN